MVARGDLERGSCDPPSAFEPFRRSKVTPERFNGTDVISSLHQGRDEADSVEKRSASYNSRSASGVAETKDGRDSPEKEVATGTTDMSSTTVTALQPQENKSSSWTSGVVTSWFAWLDPTYVSPSPQPKAPENEIDEDSVTANSTALFKDLPALSVAGDSTRAGTVTGGASVQTSDIDGDAQTVQTQIREQNVAAIIAKKVNNMDHMPVIEEDEIHSNENRRKHLVKELKTTITTFGRYDIRVANISAALGDLLVEMYDVESALKLHRDAVSIYRVKFGDSHNTTIQAQLQLAKHLLSSKHLSEAVKIYFDIFQMNKALHGDKDPLVADSLVLLAKALRKQEDFTQAIKELKRALKIYRDALGDGDEHVSKTVDEIASLYVTIGDFEKSAAILEEVVKLRVATMGLKSAAVAETLVDLATIHECSDDFPKALKSLKKAYKIYADIGGFSSIDSISTLNRIAQLYDLTEDNERASIAYLGVLRGRKLQYGSESLSVGETYFKLGISLRKTSQSEKSLKCMKEALPIYVAKGVELSDVEMIAEIMHEMALIHKEKRRYHESHRILTQELDVRKKIGQPEYPHIARTLNHLGVVEYELRNTSKALKYLVDALGIFQKQSVHGVDCAEVLYNSGLVFETTKNYERAMDAYEEASRIFRTNGYDESHPHMKKVTSKIDKMHRHLNIQKPR